MIAIIGLILRPFLIFSNIDGALTSEFTGLRGFAQVRWNDGLGAIFGSCFADGIAEMAAQEVDVFLICQFCSRLDETSCVVPHQVP